MPEASPAVAQSMHLNPPRNADRDRRPSWMAPDAKQHELLYVSDVGTDDVDVYSYPEGRLKGTLTGFARPAGLCVDNAGNVFITDLWAFHILEYAHAGTKPIATLKDPDEDPGDCAVSRTDGTLAVTNESTSYSGPGDVVTYAHAKGRPTPHTDAQMRYYQFCGYDDRGDLFVDGVNGGDFAFAELPAGQRSLENITLDKHIGYGGAVRWDGDDVAVGDYESHAIDRFRIRGVGGREVGQTRLKNSSYPIGFWIKGSIVVAPNDGSANVMFWKYPAGGPQIKTIGGLLDPWGTTVSVAR